MILYSTTTGQAPSYSEKVAHLFAKRVIEEWEEFCFICHRATDHTMEHEDGRDEYGTRRIEGEDSIWIEHYAYVWPK
jgi:hypothetical protein